MGGGRKDRRTPWAQRTALRLARHVPAPLLAYPERVFINFAAIVLGLAALWPPPGGVVEQWPDWFRLEWAAAMILSGASALHGTWTGYRPTERLGAALFALCTLAFGAQAFVTFGWAATATGVLFIALCLAKVLRVVRSFAVSAEITTYQREDPDAALPPRGDGPWTGGRSGGG